MRQEVGVRACSDHFPLILDTSSVVWGPVPFLFENMWLGDPNFRNKFAKWWNSLNPTGWESFKIMENFKDLNVNLKVE